MKALIKHYWINNREEILKRSLFNCHVRGLHSIMLSESPGKAIRLFYAIEPHPLWMNCSESMRFGLSVGFHPHHCNITLVPVFGAIVNWVVIESKTGMPVRRFSFDSKINGGKGAFTFEADTFVDSKSQTTLTAGYSEHMEATDLHTVFVAQGKEAAWLVFEGRENPDHKALCFSNTALNNHSIAGLYEPMTPKLVEDIIERCCAIA